mgnify:CR=1 FL=1
MNSVDEFLRQNKSDTKKLTKNLGISLVILIVLLEFFKRVTNNTTTIFKNYFDDHRVIYGSEQTSKNDNYNYSKDLDYENKKVKILKSIRHIKINNNRTFDDLTKYKKKYNLNTDIKGTVDRKVLSKEYDNYKYENQPNVIDFLLDVFKPTKA